MELKDYYGDKTERLRLQIGTLKRRDPYFLASELLTFAVFAVCGFMFFFSTFRTVYAVLSLLSLSAYMLVRTADRRNSDRIGALEALLRTYGNELCYLRGDFSVFFDGTPYVDASHPYAFDLDIFGPDSLFNRMDRTVTSGGRERLAAMLGTLPADSSRKTLDGISRRAAAIRELSEYEEWMAAFKALGNNCDGRVGVIPTGEMIEAVRAMSHVDLGVAARSPLVKVAALLSIVVFVSLIVATVFTPLSSTYAVLWACLQFVVTALFASRHLKDADAAIGRLHSRFTGFVRLMEHLHGTEFRSEVNAGIRKTLFADEADALEAFRSLSKTLEAMERRGNGLWMFLTDACTLNGIFLLRRLQRWDALYINKVYGWIDAVSRMDALVSMATFRFNEPCATTATVTDDAAVVYEARGLYHPFVGCRAVKNDFSIADRNYYIVTGANMAGKSTFLRSIGINYVLALNGMPVFADSLTVSVFNLFTNMRTTDDLTRGISYFNAELLRLKQLMQSCRSTSRHSLIILDEILKGTNSLDKLNGSVYFLESIAGMPVSGVIATHDLELSKLAERCSDRFHNWCFEIELGSKITYSYKITPGVARNQNATYLLRNIISDVLGRDGEEDAAS